MCTVTIIPKANNGFVLTSNRDEAPNRVSIAPDFYITNGVKMVFPKDEVAGGTWIGLSEKNRVVCVLNGGFKWHERKLSYRKSRGVVAKDLMIADDIEDTIETYNLQDIEPFTIIIIDWNVSLKFYELVWDGENKHFKPLPPEPKIWSSSTLYSEDMKQERLGWFESFKNNHALDETSILKFHKTAGSDNKDFGVVMDRGVVKTTSITQIVKEVDSVKMVYENLQNKTITTKIWSLPEVVNG
ncbi:NRDE family protein [Flavivirga spongiicola]|uniref:NRDE family protein n=1 Tax=Flavivirga spongiicola TaxID=421621 RepID=A0ABU7XVT0_9FLAO|nr:NRDE family protein [Flavivirga sp. MEBiC05379]MDO5979881.1 NRDE family protein [Flavivirga sp. MEBiC05379]